MKRAALRMQSTCPHLVQRLKCLILYGFKSFPHSLATASCQRVADREVERDSTCEPNHLHNRAYDPPRSPARPHTDFASLHQTQNPEAETKPSMLYSQSRPPWRPSHSGTSGCFCSTSMALLKTRPSRPSCRTCMRTERCMAGIAQSMLPHTPEPV